MTAGQPVCSGSLVAMRMSVQNIRRLISASAAETIAGDLQYNSSYSSGAKMGLYPSNWIQDNDVFSPYGAPVYTTVGIESGEAIAMLGLAGIPKADCIRLINAICLADKSVYADVSPSGHRTGAGRTQEEITDACSGSATNNLLMFKFMLGTN